MHVAERRLDEKALYRVSRQLIPLIQVDDSLRRNSALLNIAISA
jgi:hypothetical protein